MGISNFLTSPTRKESNIFRCEILSVMIPLLQIKLGEDETMKNQFLKRALFTVTICLLAFGGCEGERTYMEECEKLLVEKPDNNIFWKADDKEYPAFKEYHYYSRTAERETPVMVLLPLDYSEEKKYPVLYLLHGYWNDEKWMTGTDVRLNVLYQNLLDEGEIAEMILVSPYIYCSKDMQYCTAMDTINTLNYDNFINDLMADLMPFVEENFSVAKGPENTAITGFSMGARESLFIGFKHPEIFGYIGSVCPAPGVTEGTGYPYNLERSEFCFKETHPYLLLISASNTDGVVGTNPMTYHEMLTQNGTEHLWHLLNGTGHDATSVKPHLYNFLRMIFRK